MFVSTPSNTLLWINSLSFILCFRSKVKHPSVLFMNYLHLHHSTSHFIEENVGETEEKIN